MNRASIARGSLLLVLLALGAFAWMSFQGRLNASAIEAGIRNLGALAPLMFIAAFALATVLFVPGSIFGLAGGILFGPLEGAAWNLAGGTLGAAIAFSFSHYVLATAVCMAPGALAFAWLGHAGRAAAAGDSDALRYGVLGLAAFALVAFGPRLIRRLRQQSSAFVSLHELRDRLASPCQPLVVDVREPAEFNGRLGHIEGAINIPLGQLPAAWSNQDAGVSGVVVVCRTDQRSARAAGMLQAKGVREVKVLRGGMEAWRRHDANA